MGAGADVNAVFGIASMLIGIPTGVKIFNWLFTMYGGRVRFNVPMYWTIGFMLTFVIGGLTGVLLAMPPVDFVVHNSLFLVAHFHQVIIGGVVFALMAGYTYWFPKAFGFTLHEGLGKASFWCWIAGFYLAFMPLYVLGLAGATRRMQHYTDLRWLPWFNVATAGAFLILCGIVLLLVQLAVSIRTRERRRDLTGDPWDGRTLEWSTPSPPPPWNYAALPLVHGLDAFAEAKRTSGGRLETGPPPAGGRLHVPRRSMLGFVVAFFAFVMGFALVWHMTIVALAALVAVAAAVLVHGWRADLEEEVAVAASGAGA
jgi:cytochrome o ubiquinol oxidase subunit 1